MLFDGTRKMYEFTVTFQDSYRKERIIGHVKNESKEKAHEAAWDCIMQFLREHSYVSYYQRVTVMPMHGIEDVEWIDVGSWSEFFHIYPADELTVDQAIRSAEIEPAYY